MAITEASKAYGSEYHKKNFPHLYEEDYFGSEKDIETRKKFDTYLTPDMYFTDEEKADRLGGKYLSEPLNFASSALLMGGTTPSDIVQIKGQDTKTKEDDYFIDKYSSELYYNQAIKKIDPLSGTQYTTYKKTLYDAVLPEVKEILDERVAKTGSNPIGNAFGVLMLPFDAIGLTSLVKSTARGGFKFLKNRLKNAGKNPVQIKEAEKVYNSLITPDVMKSIKNAASPEEKMEILLFNLQNKNKAFMSKTDTFDDVPSTSLTSRVNEIQNLINFDKDYAWNLKNLTEGPNSIVGKNIGDSSKAVTKDTAIRSIKKAMIDKLQFSVDEYKDIFMKMRNDRKYIPPDETFNPLNPGQLRTLPGGKKSKVAYNTPNSLEARRQLAKELGIDYKVLASELSSAARARKDAAALQRAIEAGPDAYAAYMQRRYGRTKATRRARQAGDEMGYSSYDRAINTEFNTKRSVENLNIFNNKTYAAENIFNNKRFMDMLSTAVDPKTGLIKVNAAAETTIKSLIKDKKFWQIDHINPIQRGGAGLDLPSNKQLIPGILNVNFKENAELFIKNNYKNTEAYSTIQNLLNKANELQITLRPDIPKSSLKDMGINTVTMGYKQPLTEKGLTLTRFDNQMDFYYGNKGNAMGGTPINRRQGYAELNEEGVQPLTVAGLSTTDSNIIDIPTPIVEVQDDIKKRFKETRLAEKIKFMREKTNIKLNDMLDDTQKIMNKGDRPIEVRLLTEGYKLITDNPLVEAAVASPYTIYNTLLHLSGAMYNAATGKNIDVRKEFPATFEIADRITSGAGETPEDQTYISLIDEINRAQDKGISSLGYNIVDIAASTKDWAFGGEATEKVRASYDKMIKEGKISTPETFIGEVGAIGVEFGVPAGGVFKGINLLRRMLKSKTGVNLFATQTYGLTGASLFGTRISNVSKRVGTSALTFAGTDLIAGGPYNTATEVFHEDGPLFTYDLIDTEGLSGRDLAVANLKNRLRFGAEGAMIGGLFPLVGPPLWAATKYGVIKPSLYVGGKTLQLGNQLAIKPLSYLAGGTLKAPFSKPGAYEVSIPLMKEVNQGIAGGVKTFAEFLGKDIITRATVKAMGASPGFIKQLPDFKDWRMFDVNSKDPLKANLKKIDNIFSYFREAGIRSPDQLYLDVAAQNFIKSKSRQIEKLLDSVEVKAYDLANGFLKSYNKATTSPAGQDYLLDQVLAYIKGQIKLTALPKELQSTAKALSDEFDAVRNLYKDILPDESGLKMFLNTNLKSYIRQSFAMFTNPQFKPNQKLKDDAINFVASRIRNNESLVELAIKGSTQSTEASIRRFAEQQVDDLLATVKTEGIDPIIALQNITKNNLKMDDIVIQTGEELPAVIRKLLGEEGNLRSSVMQTTSSLVTQATNLKNYDRIGQLLLNEGRLFASRDEAIRAGIVNPMPVDRVPGLGLLDSDISKLYGSKEVVSMLRGSLGQLDKFMESSIYQGMIAYKAGVQTGKTVLSPATQTRNFGSAAAFVLNNGWIGGRASVSDAFKITLDDIFGAGRTVNEEELIKNIARKSELGVIDENIVASELSAVLADIKAGKVSTFGKLAGMADNSKLMKTATRLYSGGDNVWKWYAHEYLMSALKGGFRNVDQIKKAVKDDFGITQFNPKNMSEAIEEYAAMMVRELMPTYSKVPPMIQAIRKIPFIGNFVSFPAEIIRTSAATSTLAMKHIASDNATLRAMGYKSLMGQFATLWGLNEGARGLGYAMTNITPEQIKTYKDEFAADYMKFSDLVPISNLDEKRGTFKVFDMSRYNPYDLISSTVNNLIIRATDPKAKLDPNKIETDVLAEYFNASGPLLDLLNGTLFGLSIGTEGVYEALSGKTKTGSSVWSPSDTFLEKFDKAIMHILNKNEPGVVSSAQRTWSAFSGDVSGTGQPVKIGDEMFKLLGGSTVTVDVPGSFAYKISEFQNTFKEPKVSESWYSTKNYQNRGPAQLVREYNEMNEEAFRQQYQFYRAVRAALDSGLMTRDQIRTALKDRKLGKKQIRNILDGTFSALSWGEGGLESRYKKIQNANPDKIFDKYDFIPRFELNDVKRKWDRMKFEDFEVERKEPEQVSQAPIVPNTVAVEPEIPVPQVAETGAPVVNPNAMAGVTGVVNPATGLTKTETALLSPGEKAIRQGQRGIA